MVYNKHILFHNLLIVIFVFFDSFLTNITYTHNVIYRYLHRRKLHMCDKCTKFNNFWVEEILFGIGGPVKSVIKKNKFFKLNCLSIFSLLEQIFGKIAVFFYQKKNSKAVLMFIYCRKLVNETIMGFFSILQCVGEKFSLHINNSYTGKVYSNIIYLLLKKNLNSLSIQFYISFFSVFCIFSSTSA